ncbi:unnamed protein product [Rotaria sp. Silwood2]|nr:unnamed protein product [Rotaria sp. Silwood2]
MLPHSQIDLRSNEDIQHTFNDFQDDQIISCIDCFQEIRQYRECHIYSYPYKFKIYKNITINFQGGLYKCVREILLMDERPFEHEFFLRIAQSFPSLINENQLAIEVERKLKNILKARRQTRKRKLKRQQHEEKQQKTTTASGIDRTGSDDDDDDEPLDLTIK